MDGQPRLTMHICELVRLMPVHGAGGMQMHAALLARMLVRAGHRVTLLTAERPDMDEEHVDGVRIVYVRGARPERHTAQGWAALNRAWSAIHAAHPFDVVHAHSSAGEGWARRRFANAPPLVVTMHGTHLSDWLTSMRVLQGRPRGQVKSTLYMLWTYLQVATRYLPRAEGVIFAGATNYRRGRWLYPLPRRRALIPNGIDVDHFSPAVEPAQLRGELGLADGVPIMLGVGRMLEEKGFRTAVEALLYWTGTRPYLLLLGDGPDVPVLRQLAQRLGVGEQVRLIPAVSQAALPGYLNAADLFIFPTWCEEGMPLALLEAMACARPIVASDLGGVRTVAANGEAAVLVPMRDRQALHSACAHLLTDRDHATRLGETARQLVVDQYSAERMARLTLDFFAQVRTGRGQT